MKLRLKKDLVIGEGAVFSRGPRQTTYGADNFELSLGLTPDHTISVVVFQEEGIEEWFEEVGEVEDVEEV